MTPILSILIPTLPERAASLARVIQLLGNYPEVEILTDSRGREVTTGEKRNALIDRATGEYVMFQDDDDEPLPDLINHILTSIRNGSPDCVTYTGFMTTNGANRVEWVIKLGERYEARQGVDGITRYYRFPNHLCAIKRSIAAQVKFPHIWQGEDFAWAKILNDARTVPGTNTWMTGPNPMLKTSVHVESPPLYHYAFRTQK